MIQGAIFDFDGTLADSMYFWENIGSLYLRSLGKEPGPEVLTAIQNMTLRKAAEYFHTTYGLSQTADEIVAAVNGMMEEQYFYHIQPKPGVIPLLEELRAKGIPMCIATATDRYLVDRALERCGMKGFFSEVFTCSQIGHGKDRPDIFRAALAHLGTDKAHTPVFDDAHHAVLTAKADGFPVVGIFDLYEHEPQIVRETADLYLEQGLADRETFWAFAEAL